MKRFSGFLVAVACVSISISAQAQSRGKSAEWGPTIDQRIAWADAYTKRTCPHMPPPTAEELARKNEIGGVLVYQWMVASHIDGKCPKKVAGR